MSSKEIVKAAKQVRKDLMKQVAEIDKVLTTLGAGGKKAKRKYTKKAAPVAPPKVVKPASKPAPRPVGIKPPTKPRAADEDDDE